MTRHVCVLSCSMCLGGEGHGRQGRLPCPSVADHRRRADLNGT
ncbi:hypothetical protein A3768_4479 (plasmid) [Ralstonia solanacearum]|nr:hypothetical protein F504_5018 [Ralstonia pseudosolanacearum FQY_4]ANH35292.1 hypothetical protein A3768_4479 [Ralstonia solanacearum]